MTPRPRVTVRARLTLLSTALFAACAAVVVAISYALVAGLEPEGEGRPAPASFLERCRAEERSPIPDDRILAKCDVYFRLQGAQRQRDLTLSHLLEYSAVALAVGIALAAALGWVVAGRALRPLKAITEAARAASEDNLSARLGLRGPRDELHELAATFDAMLDRLEAAFESRQRFIANTSHELRTPLAVMRATVDVVLDDPDTTASDLRGMAADIRAAVDRVERLLGALLILARNERGLVRHEPTDLATIAEDAVDAVGAELRHLRVLAELEPAPTSGDPVLLERLVVNLVDNAVRYNRPDGTVWLQTSRDEGLSRLVVANTGPLVSAADAARVFAPFERLDERGAGDGSGLGLAIVASIARMHGGTVTAEPRDGGGLVVSVRIPAG